MPKHTVKDFSSQSPTHQDAAQIACPLPLSPSTIHFQVPSVGHHGLCPVESTTIFPSNIHVQNKVIHSFIPRTLSECRWQDRWAPAHGHGTLWSRIYTLTLLPLLYLWPSPHFLQNWVSVTITQKDDCLQRIFLEPVHASAFAPHAGNCMRFGARLTWVHMSVSSLKKIKGWSSRFSAQWDAAVSLRPSQNQGIPSIPSFLRNVCYWWWLLQTDIELHLFLLLLSL